MYDVIIVGGAAAGLTAGIYSARRGMKTLIITKEVGGQAGIAPLIENYPGYLEIHGYELMKRFHEQALKAGVEIAIDEVKQITGSKGAFLVKTGSKEYEGKSVILAFGKTPRSLGVPGEKEYLGKGVFYCATCDMPLFKGKTVVVVGGGNAALEVAQYGSDIVKKLYLVHRRDQFRGFEYLVDRLRERKNVEIVLNSVVTEIRGKKFVDSVIVKFPGDSTRMLSISALNQS